MYVKRDHSGHIQTISRESSDEISEFLADDSEELQLFFSRPADSRRKTLAETDLEMARVLEDLVGLLIERNLIRFTDLPAAAQTKLLSRRELRRETQGMDLLDDADDFSL